MTPLLQTSPAKRARQSGVVLIVALIVLVAMSLAAVVLMRSVDTGSLIARNLAFRQSSALGGDLGFENARAVLLAAPDLTANDTAAGYYASAPDAASLDLTGNRLTDKSKWVAWPGTLGTGPAPFCLPEDSSTGNTVCYIIHRLCDGTGAISTSTCHTFSTPSYGGGEGGRVAFTGGVQGPAVPGDVQGYFRVTVRTKGPGNSVSFLQAFIVI
jgi:hypothetical protein